MNGDVNHCTYCDIVVIPAKKSEDGVAPQDNESRPITSWLDLRVVKTLLRTPSPLPYIQHKKRDNK